MQKQKEAIALLKELESKTEFEFEFEFEVEFEVEFESLRASNKSL